ncbi:Hypothetical protein GbCGDNIH3_7066 [Granulibacter bethesdensis]|uniref:Uncharacterized protein n=1 Tax=Granulibacter bethesdensis TaxID=364410 RepID=A0AAN0RE14_9PROT|nr:hypothetical protein [Granulibacter bethesdensis]AHJ63242.1 Hypothetical protein GbCGDNIH3_7066 [Granulibacter bethesdensis]
MSFTQQDIDRLKAAIASAGLTQQVSFADGTHIRRMSPDDAARLLDMMQRDVAASAVGSAVPPSRVVRASPRSGY